MKLGNKYYIGVTVSATLNKSRLISDLLHTLSLRCFGRPKDISRPNDISSDFDSSLALN